MSYLPYKATPVSGWVAAASGSAVVHAALFVVAFGVWQHARETMVVDDPKPAPDFTITLEQLDTDTLIGLTRKEGVAGGNPNSPPTDGQNDPAPTPPETASPDTTPPDDTSTDPAVAADPTVPDPAEPDPAEPESTPTAPAEPDTAAVEEPPARSLPQLAMQSEPAPANPLPPDPLPADPVLSNPVLPDPIIPDPVEHTPVILYGENPAQVAGPGISQVSSGFGAGPDPDTGVNTTPDTGTNTAPGPDTDSGNDPQIAMANPAPSLPTAPGRGDKPITPDAPPPSPPSEQDLALGDLIQRIRTAPATPCLISLPRRDGPSGVGLALIGDDGQKMVGFSNEVLPDLAGQIRQTRTLVDPRQCPALNYVASNRDYPASRLGVRLDSAAVPSGGRLSGVVRGVAGKSVLMMVIDANGVVQDLDRFTTINGNFARFEVPVTRSGPLRDTSQLLVILATTQPANTLRTRMGQEARDVFAGLDTHDRMNAAMAVTTFVVR